MSELVARLAGRMAPADEERFMLQRVQPALIGLIDGTVSTLAPIFATAFLAGSHAALFVGLAAALGAGISMGLSEALSDDGTITGRGTSLSRGVITGGATFFAPDSRFRPLAGATSASSAEGGVFSRTDFTSARP